MVRCVTDSTCQWQTPEFSDNSSRWCMTRLRCPTEQHSHTVVRLMSPSVDVPSHSRVTQKPLDSVFWWCIWFIVEGTLCMLVIHQGSCNVIEHGYLELIGDLSFFPTLSCRSYTSSAMHFVWNPYMFYLKICINLYNKISDRILPYIRLQNMLHQMKSA